MKKITLPLALCAIASAAAAQTTVQPTAQTSLTIYGVADAAYTHGSGSVASKSALNSGGNQTSRLGFKGERKLKDGLSANFVYEAQVSTDSGEGQATNTNNQASGTSTATAGTQGLTFARRSTVSLVGSAGEVRLGRDFTAHYRNRVEVDPFSNVGVGTLLPHQATQGGPTSTRASNIIAYFLPANRYGIYGQVQHYFGENASNSTEPDSGSGDSVRLGYAVGKLNVSVATGRTKYLTTATTGSITSSNIGVQYDFGAFKAMTGYFRDSVSRTAPLVATGWSVGGIAPVATGEVKVAISRYGTDAAGQPESRKYAVGYVHNLLPDTVAYATVARVTNSGGASVALGGATTGANKSSTGYDVGLRYTF